MQPESDNFGIAEILKNTLLAFVLFLIIHLGYIYFLLQQDYTVLAGLFLGIAFDIKILSIIFIPCVVLSFFLKGFWNKIIVSLHLMVLMIYVALEASMSFFTIKSGSLISREILIRPIPEMWETLKSSSYTSTGVILLLMLIVIGIFLKLIIDKYLRICIRKNKVSMCLVITIPLILGFVIRAPKRLQLTSVVYYNMAVNKLDYFLKDAWEYKFAKKEIIPIVSNEELLRYRMSRGWNFENILYPLMRPTDTGSTLYPLFHKMHNSPDIVFIIVESLGSQICGSHSRWGSFTPFLDSLAQHSLYWPNCLATTERTFGVLPSALGSLPFGYNGFQFGAMPYHTSLLKSLKDNGYYTAFHYAGYPDFDNMKDFMLRQNIDTIPPYFQDFMNKKYKNQSSSWGIDDKILLDRVIDLDKVHKWRKAVDVVLTISTHEQLKNKEVKYYTDKVNKIIELQSDEIKKKRVKDEAALLTSYLYTDDAIKDYFHKKQKETNFRNTIFVIIGDHSVYAFHINDLDAYQVPLIIYSPLLKRSKQMNAVVSHLDITPSLVHLLEKNALIKPSTYQSWVGEQLDTAGRFRNLGKQLFMRSSRQKVEFLDGDYFLSHDILYKVDSAFNITRDASENTKKRIREDYELYNRIDNYTYDANKIIDPYGFGMQTYRPIYSGGVDTTMSVQYPQTIVGLFSKRLLQNTYNHIRFIVLGELLVDSIYKEGGSMSLVLRYKADKEQPDRGVQILKLVKVEKSAYKWLKFSLSGEFTVSDTIHHDLEAFIWNGTSRPKDRLQIRNLKYTIEGY